MNLDDFFINDTKNETEKIIKYSNNDGDFARILKKQIPNIELLLDINLAKELADKYESVIIIAKSDELSWVRIVLSGQLGKEEISALIQHARKNRSR
jgi:hypothetical protein